MNSFEIDLAVLFFVFLINMLNFYDSNYKYNVN